eukprot:5291670-Pyramimonas_sp.AAC.1
MGKKDKEQSAAEFQRLNYMSLRANGKQFAAVPLKAGIMPDVYFNYAPRMFEGEKYEPKLPRGKAVKGFSSSNAVERGEFGNVRRCDGAREVMLKEFFRERNERKRIWHKNVPRVSPNVKPLRSSLTRCSTRPSSVCVSPPPVPNTRTLMFNIILYFASPDIDSVSRWLVPAQELPPLMGVSQSLPTFRLENDKIALFDLVYDHVNPVKAQVPDYDNKIFKLERDTKNPARLVNERFMGEHRCAVVFSDLARGMHVRTFAAVKPS